ncbi:hypothetical protein ABNF16_21640, partial [Paenibacillus larvae]
LTSLNPLSTDGKSYEFEEKISLFFEGLLSSGINESAILSLVLKTSGLIKAVNLYVAPFSKL